MNLIFNADMRSDVMCNAADYFPVYTGSNKQLSAITTQWKDMVKINLNYSIF